jgi:hypothetical protein
VCLPQFQGEHVSFPRRQSGDCTGCNYMAAILVEGLQRGAKLGKL